MITNKLRFVFYSLLVVATILFIALYSIHQNKTEIEKQFIQNQIKINKTLSQETDIFFSGINSDLNFLKNTIESTKSLPQIGNLVKTFLISHKEYFKFRIITEDGQELFKIVQDRNGNFLKLNELFNESNEIYFQKIQKIDFGQNYISNFDYYRVNGEISMPYRPTVRFAKKAILNNKIVFLILNLEAEVLFHEFVTSLVNENELSVNIVNGNGEILLTSDDGFSSKYLLDKRKINEDIFKYFQNSKSDIFEAQDKHGTYTIWTLSSMFNKNNIFEEKYYIYTRSKAKIFDSKITKIQNIVILISILFLITVLYLLYKFEKKRIDLNTSKEIIKEQENFIANVSHQLRTPLTLMLIEINSKEKESGNFEIFKSLKEEVNYLVKVVNNLLILSKLDSGKDVFVFRNVNIDELIIYIISRLNLLSENKNIKIIFNIDQYSEFVIKGDEELLRCLFENVIENAIKYSPENSQIKIDLKKNDGKFIIEVSDQGIGVSEANIDKIFTYFFREKSHVKGTGLGLSLARKIVKLHKGEINYKKNQDVGSTFVIELGIE
jgi:signal transduction histidine kinase